MFVRVVTDIGDIAEWAGTILMLVFLVQYTLYAKWWRNFIGRSVVFLDICLLGLLIPSCIILADPHLDPFFEGHWYLLTEVLDLCLVTYVSATRIWGWRKLHRASRLGNKED